MHLEDVNTAPGEQVRPGVRYARSEGAARIADACRLAHQIEELLVEAAKDPAIDVRALHMAGALTRSLLVELGERPRMPSSEGGASRVA
jgi:hypothetical protein